MPKQNTSPADYPQAVLHQIEQLAQNITIARKRRGETQAQWAKKLGVSQPTMARIERGDPAVAMASYVMCMWLINPAVGLADLISPLSDHAALEREVSKASKKRGAPGSTGPRKAARVVAAPSVERPGSLEGENKLADWVRKDGPSNEARKPLVATNRLADLVLKNDPSAGAEKPMVERNKLAEFMLKNAFPGAARESNTTANGLAELLLKTSTKRQ